MLKYSWKKYVAITLLALGALYVGWASHPVWEKQWLNDDSFITLTYAKNLVNGNGFVYNHPPATLGTTTPLFAALAALLTLTLPPIDVIESAIVLTLLPWIGTGFLLYLIANHLEFNPLASAVVALVPLTIVNETWLWFIGMEIWLFQFLLVLSFYLVLTQRQILAGLTVGLLFLTRGEGVLVGGILTIYSYYVNKRVPKRFLVAVLTMVAIWSGYALLTFGTVLPNTLAAKTAHQEWLINHGREFNFLDLVKYQVPDWLNRFNLNPSFFSNIFLISVMLGLCFILFQKQLFWSLFLIWVAAYFLAYTMLNPRPYPWYALHFYFVMEVMAGLGIGWLVDIAFKQSGAKKVTMGLVACSLACLLVGPNLIRGVNSVQSFNGDGRAPAYTAVADWLNSNTQPEDSIAYLEIGYLGYYSQNRIVDLAGLIDPVIASNIGEHGFAWGFWHYLPTYFLFNPGMDSEAYLAGIRSATNEYEEVARFSDGPDGLPLVLFRRIE